MAIVTQSTAKMDLGKSDRLDKPCEWGAMKSVGDRKSKRRVTVGGCSLSLRSHSSRSSADTVIHGNQWDRVRCTRCVTASAAVTLADENSSTLQTATSNAAGSYVFLSIPPRAYTVQATYTDFKTVEVDNHVAQVAQPSQWISC